MKTMKRFAARFCALFVVLTVSLTALVPAAFAATKAQLPDLPSSQCVVDDANILSSSTKTAIENLNAQLTQQCEGAQDRRIDCGLYGKFIHGGLCRAGSQHLGAGQLQ